MIAKALLWLYRRSWSAKDRALLTTELLTSIDAVPLRNMITIDENRRILVQGKPLSPEQALSLQQGAQAALDNPSLKIVREQVRFNAIHEGYLKSLDPTRDANFYKSALWYVQEEKELLQALAGAQDPTL